MLATQGSTRVYTDFKSRLRGVGFWHNYPEFKYE